jgi:hypothetical protein
MLPWVSISWYEKRRSHSLGDSVDTHRISDRYPQSLSSTSQFHTYVLRTILILSFNNILSLPNTLPMMFPHQNSVYILRFPLPATCLPHRSLLHSTVKTVLCVIYLFILSLFCDSLSNSIWHRHWNFSLV